MKDAVTVILIGLLIGLLFCFPLVQIWALNTLFPVLSIPYGFFTWLAIVVMNISWFAKPAVQRVKLDK